VLLDQSLKEIKKDYIFKFLFDSKGFDLGHPVSDLDFETGNKTLETIITDLVLNFENISNKTLEYYNKNHSIESVSSKLLNLLNNSCYHLSEIDKPLLKNGLLRKIYLCYLKKIKKSYY